MQLEQNTKLEVPAGNIPKSITLPDCSSPHSNTDRKPFRRLLELFNEVMRLGPMDAMPKAIKDITSAKLSSLQ